MEERIVLLSSEGRAIGTAPKYAAHHRETPLHLAFSCYLFDDAGRVLLTRRAWTKPTWPGVWTNSCCGHPMPGEPLLDAVARRLAHELGARADEVRLVLPGFRYHAVMDSGVAENEMCPVFWARLAGPLTPNPAEVAAVRWIPWPELVPRVLDGRQVVSPWCRSQVIELAALGDPAGWPTGDPAKLPAAARLSAARSRPASP